MEGLGKCFVLPQLPGKGRRGIVWNQWLSLSQGSPRTSGHSQGSSSGSAHFPGDLVKKRFPAS